MESFFFRVEHDLLRSESFKSLGGSAIKVYLVLGLYADFSTGWAYPSIRTIAKQAGLSRQTVLAALDDLARLGMLATSKSPGRSTAYKLIRQAPPRPGKAPAGKAAKATGGVPDSLGVDGGPIPVSLGVAPKSGPISFEAVAQFLGPAGPEDGPKREPGTREDTASIPIPGTPFHLNADGRLTVAVDLQELLADQGIPRHLAARLASRKDPGDVAKVLLNAFYLQSQGKLQNGPGYIRAGIEDGYDLLPQVATRLESRRRELEERLRAVETRRDQLREEAVRVSEEAAMAMVLDRMRPEELQRLVYAAVASLPEPIVRRNPTLSNPFVRSRVYELAGGEPGATS